MTGEIRIRPGRADEHEALRALEMVCAARFEPYGFGEGVIADSTPLEELEAARLAGRVFVADWDGRVVGFAFVEPEAVDGAAHLAELDVHPDVGRRGLGSRIVRHVADWARAEGYAALTLTTFRDVPFNRPFYERLGFRVIPEERQGPDLREIVQREDAIGLARAERVAMRLVLRGAARHAPATARNRAPILEVLRRVLPPRGTVLEIAAGTGEHAAYFGASLPHLSWQPTDADQESLASITTIVDAVPNVRAPCFLDVRIEPWTVEHADALLCINMIHIAPWETCLALFRGAAQVLDPAAPVVLYGPYRIDGAHTAPSNEAFDADLRTRNPAWGVRDLEDVIQVAADAGFRFETRTEMPANNQTVVFRRGSQRGSGREG